MPQITDNGDVKKELPKRIQYMQMSTIGSREDGDTSNPCRKSASKSKMYFAQTIQNVYHSIRHGDRLLSWNVGFQEGVPASIRRYKVAPQVDNGILITSLWFQVIKLIIFQHKHNIDSSGFLLEYSYRARSKGWPLPPIVPNDAEPSVSNSSWRRAVNRSICKSIL